LAIVVLVVVVVLVAVVLLMAVALMLQVRYQATKAAAALATLADGNRCSCWRR
jgi:hypothetical protein